MSKDNQRTNPRVDPNQAGGMAAAGDSPVGAWRLTLAPVQGTPTPALITIGEHGTLITASLPVEPFLGAADRVIFVSAGHGLWKATGPKTMSFTIVGLAATERGSQAASALIAGRVEINPGGHLLSGTYHATVFDPAGMAMATEDGMLQASRIELVEQVEPAR